MGEEGEDSFEACLRKAFLWSWASTKTKVFHKTALYRRRCTCCAPHRIWQQYIFQLLALTKGDCVVLVICPLKSIVNDQIKEASSTGIISAGSRSLSCGMPVFVTYLPCQTFSLLVAGNSYENISRVGFINNFDLEAAFGKIIYIQILVKIIVIFLLRCLKALLPKFQSFPRRLSVVCFCHGRY